MSSPLSPAERLPTDWKSDAMRKRIARRYAAERRFRLLGLGAVLLSAAFLAFLLVTMMGNGLRGFTRTEIALKVDFPASPLLLDPQAITDEALANANLPMVTSTVAEKTLGKEADAWLAPTAWISVRDAIKADPTILNRTEVIRVPASTDIDLAAKSDGTPAAEAAVRRLKQAGILSTGFNWSFLSSSDGTDPTQVGIWGAFKGSLLTMLVTLVLSFPIGVATALYLEEYAPKAWWTDIIEVSINNLAAVPSIIFGLLGLSIFLNFLHLPRSAAVVGGMTLALMTMPVIVIAGRNAIKSVPPSIRDAALGIGASPGWKDSSFRIL